MKTDRMHPAATGLICFLAGIACAVWWIIVVGVPFQPRQSKASVVNDESRASSLESSLDPQEISAQVDAEAVQLESSHLRSSMSIQKAKAVQSSDAQLAASYYLNAFHANPKDASSLLAYVDALVVEDASDESIKRVISTIERALEVASPEIVERIYSRKKSLEVYCAKRAADALAEKASQSGNSLPSNAKESGFRTAKELELASNFKDKQPSAEALSDILQRIELSSFETTDLGKVEVLEADLVSRLRGQVKSEIQTLNSKALEAGNYAASMSFVAEAAGVLAMYPVTQDDDCMQEAGMLSQGQNDIRVRVESLRRMRYNYWAATAIQSSLQTLREEAVGYLDASLNKLAIVEPSLLDPATSGLYNYLVEQLMEEYENGEKATVAKTLNNPATERKSLEGF